MRNNELQLQIKDESYLRRQVLLIEETHKHVHELFVAYLQVDGVATLDHG
jgi:hypothetical protein